MSVCDPIYNLRVLLSASAISCKFPGESRRIFSLDSIAAHKQQLKGSQAVQGATHGGLHAYVV